MVDINEGIVSIDSMKLRFDIDDVEILDESILEYWFEMSEAGEVDEQTFKRKRKTIKSKGVTTSYLIQKRKVSRGETKVSLLILCNSKLLGILYFKGICSETLESLYATIMAQGVVKMSYEVFQQSNLTDVDIKMDYAVKSHDEQVKLVNALSDSTKSSRSRRTGCETKTSPTNTFIQWSKRELATNSRPHLKCYAKDIELRYNSPSFNQAYFDFDENSESVVRVEGTIKNKSHWRWLHGDEKDKSIIFTLWSVIGKSNEWLTEAISKMAKCHLEGIVKRGEAIKMTMSSVFAATLIESVGSLGIAKVKVAKWASDKSQLYKIRKQLENSYYQCFESQGIELESRSIDKIFNVLQKGLTHTL